MLIAVQNLLTPQGTAGWHYISIYPFVTMVAAYGAYAGVHALFLNSTLTSEEAQRVERELVSARVVLLYAAPERVTNPRFLAMLDSLRGHAHARSLDASPIVKPKLSIHMSLVVSSQRPATPLTTAMLALTRTIALQTLPAKR